MHKPLVAVALMAALAMSGCAGGVPTPTPTPSTAGPDALEPSQEQPTSFDPEGPPCDPSGAADFDVEPEPLPNHWPTGILVIPGPCFDGFELPVQFGTAIEFSVAVHGDGETDIAETAAWVTANSWLLDSGLEVVEADTALGSTGRISHYRTGLVQADGEDFYRRDLRVSGEYAPEGFIVFHYMLNLLDI
ncbi:MAG: hypothetical protein ABIQ01_13540 [Pseudolysinimonas sp.]